MDPVKLRDGTWTRDTRLDRVVEFDERSRAYSVAELELPDELDSVTYALARKRMLDQGREGACVSCGVTHELAGAPVAIGGLTMDWARETVYWPAQRDDQWPGGSYPGAAPVYEGTSVLAGVKRAQQLGFYEGYRWAFGIDDGLKALVHEGPGILGLNWLDGMFEPRRSGLLECTGHVAGGHCVAVRGLWLDVKLPGEDRARDVAVIPQSWGLAHGDRGVVYIDLEDLDARLRDQGEWCVPQGRHRRRG